jgi:hypothetical protein
MTIAVGYLILYAIDSHHGLAAAVKAPGVWDSLASFSSGVINITPELVFPGTVVLCIQALTRKNWFHGALYAIASVAFAWLTLALLNAYMSNGLDDGFLSGMLLWRAASSLFYTVVAELCSRQAFSTVESAQHDRQQLGTLHQQVQQLASELATVRESLQQYEEALASIPAMKAQLRRLESSAVTGVHKRAEWPVLRALPPVRQQDNHEDSRTRRLKDAREAVLQATTGVNKFDARAFVFACLQENPDLKLAEIEQLALARDQELSQSTASRYRKQFFARDESSIVQVASSNESSTMQMQDGNESASGESFAINGRVVGE